MVSDVSVDVVILRTSWFHEGFLPARADDRRRRRPTIHRVAGSRTRVETRVLACRPSSLAILTRGASATCARWRTCLSCVYRLTILRCGHPSFSLTFAVAYANSLFSLLISLRLLATLLSPRSSPLAHASFVPSLLVRLYAYT